MVRRPLLGGMVTGSVLLAAAAACGSFSDASTADRDAASVAETSTPDAVGTADGGATEASVAVFCPAERATGAGRLLRCADFDGDPNDWGDAEVAATGFSKIGKGGLSMPSALDLTISNAVDAGGSAALVSAIPPSGQPINTVELRFALSVRDVNTAVSVVELRIGPKVALSLDLGVTTANASALTLAPRPRADGGTDPVQFLSTCLRNTWVRVVVLLVPEQPPAARGTVTIDGTELPSFSLSEGLDFVAAAQASVGLVKILGANDSASVSIDDVVLRVE